MSTLVVLTVILTFSYLPENKAADSPQSRVINGIDGSIEDFPYQAQLHLQTAITFDATGIPPIDILTNAFCGGSIIHENYILTAAHCLSVNLIGFLSVVVKVGSDILDQGTASNVFALQFCSHPEYDRTSVKNDIGIIKVNVDMYSTSTPTISPVILPQTINAYSDLSMELIVAGFGRTSDTSGLSNTLKYGFMIMVERENCESPDQYGSSFPETAYCVASSNDNRNTFCNGDSGSPMIYHHSIGNASVDQVCIASFGRKESCSGYLQGCTKIDIYIKWICCVTGGAVCPLGYQCDLPLPLLNCPLLPIYPNARK